MPERADLLIEADLAVRSRRRYVVHGVHVEVSGDDPEAPERVHALLEHFGLAEAAPTPGGDPLRIRLRTATGTDPVPAGCREIARQDGIRACVAVDRIYLSAGSEVLGLDPAAGRIEAALPAPPSGPRKDLLLYGLLLLLRRRGLYGLHASGVVRQEEGCLFVAASGSGKSTLTYGLVHRGWRYLGDDALLLRARDGRVEALALRTDLCLDPALASRFPELVRYGEADVLAGRGKRRLPMRTLYADRRVEGCAPRVLVFPEIVAERESRLVPLRVPDALSRLLAQSAVFALDPEMIPRHLEILTMLAGQARSFRLLAGRDLKENPGALAARLADVHPPGAPPTPEGSRDAITACPPGGS